jgi:hypothetical protein
MSQHDMNIANQGFPAFRADLNNALAALASTSAADTEPSTTFANQLWMDTANNILKVRNEDNDAWISLATFDQTTDAVTYIDGLEIAKVIVSDAAQTFTAKQTFSGSSSVASMKTSNIAEVDTIAATAATGVIDYDVATQSVLFYTTDASGNWTVNLRGSSGTSLNDLMVTGESISVTFLVTQGATAYYNSAVTIDGSSVTPKWQGGTAPTSGNVSSVDCYTYVIQKTGAATYVVLASVTKFA